MAVLVIPLRSSSSARRVPPTNVAASFAKSGRCPDHCDVLCSLRTSSSYCDECTRSSSDRVALRGATSVTSLADAFIKSMKWLRPLMKRLPCVGWDGSKTQLAY
jgi:hypothetical protein